MTLPFSSDERQVMLRQLFNAFIAGIRGELLLREVAVNPCAEVKLPQYTFPNYPVMPTKPLTFDDSQYIRRPELDHLGPHNQTCWGCNEDDRGFVTVVGCPKHDPRPARPLQGSTDGVSGD